MKFSFCSLGCPDWSLEEIAENAKRFGYDGVELRIGGSQHVDPSMDAAERRRVKALFTQVGLSIPALSGYTRFADGEDFDEQAAALERNVGLCADLGAPYLRTFLGGGGVFSDRSAQTLRRCCDTAASSGVTVLMEIHDALSGGRQAAQIRDRVASDGFGILWDLHHSVKGGETPEETWSALGGRVLHCHIKDARADQSLCHIGEGVLPAAAMLRLLAQNGYPGFVSFEWEKMWHPELDGPETALPRFIAFARSAL